MKAGKKVLLGAIVFGATVASAVAATILKRMKKKEEIYITYKVLNDKEEQHT
jgi:hypothetical protein